MQQILAAKDHAAEQVPGRVGEHQKPIRVAGCCGNQPLIVGIAAHHAVQNYDVGRLDLVGRAGNIDEPTRYPITQP
jgi:hypothetical protein